MVETSTDYSVHCSSLNEAMLTIEAEFDNDDEESPIECTITQVWLTDEEIENMHEAD